MRFSTLYLSCCLFTRYSLSKTTCGVCAGYDRGVNAYFFSDDGSLSNFEACSAKCQSDTKCQSFAFGDSQCLLYSEPLEDNFRQQSGSPFLFYDRDCVNIEPTSSFTTVLPPTTSSSVVSATALPDLASSTTTSATSEPSDGTGSSAVSGVSSETDSAPATPATATAGDSSVSTSSETSSSGTAASTSTSSSSGSSQSSDTESIASALVHEIWWPALVGIFYLIVFV